jgi:uncharacterized protein YrrD
LHKSQEVIGTPVVIQESGKQLGAVVDLLFDSEQQQFVGCSIEHCGWWRHRKFLPREEIVFAGRDAVMVLAATSLVTFTKKHRAYTCLLVGEQRLKGRSVMLHNGTFLGLLENVYFSIDLGTLEGYELSNGLWNDLRDGRKWIQITDPIDWNNEKLIVPTKGYVLKGNT